MSRREEEGEREGGTSELGREGVATGHQNSVHERVRAVVLVHVGEDARLRLQPSHNTRETRRERTSERQEARPARANPARLAVRSAQCRRAARWHEAPSTTLPSALGRGIRGGGWPQ